MALTTKEANKLMDDQASRICERQALQCPGN